MIALIFAAIILVLAAFDIAALLWGADSREGIDDPEWSRRQDWPGFSRR
jgi:hypothetical protein